MEDKETQYVVPPKDTMHPETTVNATTQTVSKKGGWLSTHKLLTIVIAIAVVIIALIAYVLITGKKVDVFGFQLNPLYNQAARCLDCGSGEGDPIDPTAPPAITITGSIPAGTVGQLTAATLTLTGQSLTPCTWSLVSITPNMDSIEIIGTTAEGTIGQFNAIPATAGSYQVAIRVTCRSNQIANVTLPWTVAARTSSVDITGNFGNGVAGQQYSTNLSLSGQPSLPCTWSIVSTTPRIANAAIAVGAGASQNTATFTATPGTPGTYRVVINAACQNSQSVAKAFNWTVNGSATTPPPTGQLGITGSFADGKVNQAFSTTVQTTNSGNTTCTWTLKSLTPPITGAKVEVIAQSGGAINAEKSAKFSATPTTVGNYRVVISVSCTSNSASGLNTAEKEFTWKVTATTATGPGNGGGGNANNTCTTPANLSKLTAIYRFWNAAGGDHFFTTNPNEKPVSYAAEGIAGYVYNTQITGTVPIYRSYSPINIAHYYSTTNDAEQYRYNTEGVLGYAFASEVSGSLPWYRLHKGFPISDYIATTSSKEKGEAIGIGYTDAGTVAHICPKNS